MHRQLVALAPLTLVIAACTAGEAPDEASPETATAAEPEMPAVVAAPQGAEPSPSPSPGEVAEDEDACGASKVAPYIGREATVPVRSEVMRVSGAEDDRWIYPDSVVTMDFNARRLNVIMEKDTDIIQSARCG